MAMQGQSVIHAGGLVVFQPLQFTQCAAVGRYKRLEPVLCRAYS